jgi:myo-inositol 2-dehydrogenase/D-chiro-inositol 1-dehydrogenase
MLEDPYTLQIKSFYDHLAHNTPVPVTAADGYKALEIALAAITSARSGQPIAIEEGAS